jgi:hypothetical protein
MDQSKHGIKEGRCRHHEAIQQLDHCLLGGLCNELCIYAMGGTRAESVVEVAAFTY